MDDVCKLLESLPALIVRDPLAAQSVADRAVELAASQGPEIQADALIKQGAARRVVGDWESADVAYMRAGENLRDAQAIGTDWLDWMQGVGTLRRDQRRFREAESLTGGAVELCRPQHIRLGRQLVAHGLVLLYKDPRQAAPIAREALGHLASTDLLYCQSAVSVLATSLIRSGGSGVEIEAWLSTLQGFGDSLDSYPGLKVRWLEALYKMRGGSCESPEIRQALSEVITGLADLYPGEAAICAMDLAEYLIRHRRYDAARELAGDLVPVFESLRVNEEAHAALMLYKQATETEWRLGEDLAREIRSELRRIPFRPPIYYQR